MKLGENLKRYRKYNSLTQAEVAKILGIDRSTYSNYENGKSSPSIVTLNKLAKMYNVTMDSLFNGFSSSWEPLCDDSLRHECEEKLLRLSDITPAERRMIMMFRLYGDQEVFSESPDGTE